jgi:hypothetical protein
MCRQWSGVHFSELKDLFKENVLCLTVHSQNWDFEVEDYVNRGGMRMRRLTLVLGLVWITSASAQTAVEIE